MGRRLATYVHVNGVAYGPEDEVPAEVAEAITAPGVWADEVSDPTVVEDSRVVEPKRPSSTASKAAWVEYAEARGMAHDDADALTRDQLVERFPAEA